MPDELRSAVMRLFGSPEAAAKAAGLRFVDINHRAIFSGHEVPRLVASLRKLGGLQGRARRKQPSVIYHKNEENRRIIQHHYRSLQRLAEKEGLDPRAVEVKTYRDEGGVHHDLNLLEQAGKGLCHDTLKRGHKTLYNVISKTGWGRERLTPGTSG